MTLYSLCNKKTYIEIMKGIATRFPFLNRLAIRNTGGSDSARYCYSVWLRHLYMAHKNGLSAQPAAVAEIGPGDSLGIGLAALITGTDKYYAFDVVKYASDERNVKIFDELVDLFKKRENIPDEAEFPKVKPLLDSYEFPRHILTDERLDISLKQERIRSIRNALLNSGSCDKDAIQIFYFAPWYEPKIDRGRNKIDMIFSQAAMEHVDALPSTYEALYRWLMPGGFMSHTIDFSAHGRAKEWNGHWAYSDFIWKLIMGTRPYLINRQPHSSHINYLRKFGFEVVCDITFKDVSGIQKKHLAPRFKAITEDDIVTRGAFIQAVRR